MRAFAPRKESTQAIGLSYSVKLGAVTPSEQFVDVALVGGVENELILGRAENPVQGDGQFDYS